MNTFATQSMHNLKRPRREVFDVIEDKPPDKSLDKLISVRKQRLDRLTRDAQTAREAWRDERGQLHTQKDEWRAAVQSAKDYWQAERASFLKMHSTSGQFRKAKAIYDRMKRHAEDLHLKCRDKVNDCKKARAAFYEARRRVKAANREHEKLSILRDELRLLTIKKEE